MTSSAEALKAALIDDVAARLAERLSAESRDAVEHFVRSYYTRVAPDDLLGSSPENLAGAALALWSFGARREPGSPRVRVYNPTMEDHGWHCAHTVLEIVNDDMPFLVDSVTAALQSRGLSIHVVIHPVVTVARDAEGRLLGLPAAGAGEAAGPEITESFMHFELDQESGGQELEAIRTQVESVLADVRRSVDDWPAMRRQMAEIVEETEASSPPLPPDTLAESLEFLRWVGNDHFTFLSYRQAERGRDDGREVLRYLPETFLGIQPPTESSLVRPLTPAMVRFAEGRDLLVVTKSERRATVHRPVHMDYIGIKKFDAEGKVVGEHRFQGLFTSLAYSRRAQSIPLLRRKVERTLEQVGVEPRSHDGKALVHILDTFPRDELFQISEDQLLSIGLGILQLHERNRLALFVREDPFERFVSCLVFLPRDRLSTELRLKIQDILAQGFEGEVTAFYLQVADSPLARLHIIVKTRPGELPSYDTKRIEERLAAAARSWADRLQEVLVRERGEQKGLALLRRYADAFPVAYRETYRPHAVLHDIDAIEETLESGELRVSLYRPAEAAEGELRIKLYHAGQPLALSEVLPRLENMGLKVVAENPFEANPAGAGAVWISDFDLRTAHGKSIELAAVREPFRETFYRVWRREMESDSFNRLILAAGLGSQQVVVLRALARYLRQTGVTFSQSYMARTLAENPHLASALVELFEARFDPAARDGADARAETLRRRMRSGLDRVVNLDEDRIVRRYWNLIEAIVRTNVFQVTAAGERKPYLSFKIDSRRVEELPQPRPFFEIFVYSPRFEAIHLRGGLVARGGLRWSDRREDFRTEVLGLMKAQMVKNAVIVPVGSKGGFVVKRPPAEREEQLAEGRACYQEMIRGLLDLTDNLSGGEVVPPGAVVRHDGDDPYLVVAADKGTASFSDLANEVAAEYGYWLGDAFASGGSVGYDHKKMAITARGAWRSVERAFRELGMDMAREPFTAVGVGDMSGDVFGNGMLRSASTRLVGAFNHLHVFVDPDPDPAVSFAERRRLFEMRGSTWMDYSKKALSPGGGVFERSAKSVALSPRVRERFGIEAEDVAPNELISALLKAEVDLLWFGGIGTYVKAVDERHAEIGDRANDAVRVCGRELRCRVIGEGANLGLTQRGRVEAALRGTKLYTDFIDNSGGVDCSDHEVNIKILLAEVVSAGDMTRKQRDELLVAMTEEVAELVLRDNYLQTQAISVEEARGPGLLHQQMQMIRSLERAGKLNRELEFLPDDEALAERQAAEQGLTRPEIAVLLSYAKLSLYQDILGSDLPDDPLLVEDLVRYFPEPLRLPYRERIEGHRLRREIIATITTNSMVNRVGPTFVVRMGAESGLPPSEIARAYTVARDAFGVRAVWQEIEALDAKMLAPLQIEMILELGRLVERVTLWLLRNGKQPIDITQAVSELGAGVRALTEGLEEILPAEQLNALKDRLAYFEGRGVPSTLARRVASLDFLASACDMVRIADGDYEVWEVGRVYFGVGAEFHLGRLRRAALRLDGRNRWQKDAVASLVDDLYAHQRDLTARILAEAGTGVDAVERWIADHKEAFQHTRDLFEDLQETDELDLAMLTVASHQLRRLAGG